MEPLTRGRASLAAVCASLGCAVACVGCAGRGWRVASGTIAAEGPARTTPAGVEAAIEDPANAPTLALVRAGRSWGAWPYDVLVLPGYTPREARSPLDPRDVPAARRRLDQAARDFAAGLAPFVITSGGAVHPAGTTINEARAMRDYLVARGVPANRVLVEPCARHSTTNLRNAGRLMRRLGLERGLIVTGFERPVFDQAFYFAHPVVSTFSARCRRELGYEVGELAPVDAHHVAFTPSPRVATRGERDQLDP